MRQHHVARDEHQLEADEEREQVTGHDRQRDAAGEHEQDGAQHGRIRAGAQSTLADREEFDNRDRHERDREDEGGEHVDDEHDPEFGRPLADAQHDRAIAFDRDQQGDRH